MPELRPTFPQGDARNTIVDAALTVFAAKGFHGAATRQIALTAGVSQPLLLHHFRSKEALWHVVGEQITADFMAFMTDAVDVNLPPEDAITTMLRAYLNFWKERPLSFRFNLWRRLDGLQEERLSRSETMTRPVVALMQSAQASGFIRSDLPPGLAAIMGGAMVQFWLDSQLEIRAALAVTGDEGLSDEDIIEHIVRLLRTPS
ncbi:TetR/AcrR family transcriptional regulator [Roseinatronobacter bogoriensis]|uniref:TetR/AcrR family transcriptional regulator n=1 Tax=Roseinatronobacter bogoriensis subsp. barguzinensis TaxID=441209 RepID=A0A2K8KDL7_9RHOB|nr:MULTISPECIES: TetR/AcrR family transcriptional regulator [Rhodobaca]ATX67521.1 TetR/AcrR family transcriptional regulator [Rhodobaca barguzinensis]MBB4209671.1 AcrR family transcriptional regulator [Rhodobaca bogoriensis DSM 18756]TDW33847.1 TetR family transcriptional regulator [Rhodobaca barguzinensis]TDY66303.1 TetR family transcriptional regulator [Rhodobaca bogoriensis DSM 18756]